MEKPENSSIFLQKPYSDEYIYFNDLSKDFCKPENASGRQPEDNLLTEIAAAASDAHT